MLIHSMSNGRVNKHASKIRSDISEHIRVTNGNVTLLKPFVILTYHADHRGLSCHPLCFL